MIRHVVLFRWKEGTPDEVVAATIAGLATMPELIPQIRGYSFGPDAGINAANWDFVVTADFENADDYQVYRDDAHHRALIADTITPHLAERASAQFDLG